MANRQGAASTTFLQRSSPQDNSTHRQQLSLSESVSALRQSASPALSNQPSTPTSPLSPFQTPTSSPRPDKSSISPLDGKGSPRHVPFLRPQQSSPLFSRQANHFSPSNQDVGRSPRDRLNDFLSSSSQRAALRSVAAPLQAETRYEPAPHQIPPESPLYRQQRSATNSYGTNTEPPSPSPLSKISAMAALVPSVALRDSSQESLKSTQSSSASASLISTQTSHSQYSSKNTPGSDDPASLIASAGSAEAAIQNLLQENQALSARVEQLWKLAEGQGTMVVGLSKELEQANKGLQQANKEKERYRRHLNDHMITAAEAVLLAGRVDSPKTFERTRSKSPSVSSHGTSTAPAKCLNYEGRPGASQSSRRSSNDAVSEASSLKEFGFPAPPKSTPCRHENSYSAFPQAVQQQSASKLQGLSSSATMEISRFRKLSSPLSASPSPKLSPTYSSEKPKKVVPAPLNLVPAAKLGSNYHQLQIDHDDDSASDYDNSLEDETVEVRRGRQPIREQVEKKDVLDACKDYQTYPIEVVALKTKPKEPMASPTTADEESTSTSRLKRTLPAGLTAGIGLPSSPRALLMGGLQSPLPLSMGSTTSTSRTLEFAAPTSFLDGTQEAQMAGLPLSPRPTNRGLNVPRTPSAQSTHGKHAAYHAPSSPRPPLEPLLMPTTAARQMDMRKISPSLSLQPSLSQRNGERPDLSRISSSQESQLFRGFCMESYPNLILPPNALPFVKVRVHSSRLIPPRQSSFQGRSSDEEPVFQLAVHARSDGKQLWRVEKTLTSLPLLDQAFKSRSTFNSAAPDKALFNGHSPLKVDARRTALNTYFDNMLETPMDERAALILSDFFSTDAIGPEMDSFGEPSGANSPSSPLLKADFRRRREGFLAKKGKQWGGWKARYFVLDFSELRYFELPGSEALGVIKLNGATLARQNANEIEEGADFRHAFMILEPKRKDLGQVVRHILCCESDEERDGWVDALLPHTEHPDDSPVGTPNMSDRSSLDTDKGSYRRPELRAISYENTIAADAPTVVDLKPGKLPASSPTLPLEEKVASSPLLTPQKSLKDSRKRSIFGFRTKVTEEPALPQRPLHLSSPSQQSITSRQFSSRVVFGVPLAEAIRNAPLRGVNICLPAVIYRCIEYLDKSGAANEEGIFRKSGSDRVIKELKERFNTEGDVKLLEGESYDVHAVASILKMFLRELPASILTKELHLDFLQVLEIPDQREKIVAINVLVHKLPEANFDLLATLMRFLVRIVNKSDVNKMIARNVAIVFSPSLNVPDSLILLFFENFEAIFVKPLDVASSQVIQELARPMPTSSDDIRSPRRQMFSELSTPGPYQTTFSPMESSPYAGISSSPPARSSPQPQNHPATPQYKYSQPFPSPATPIINSHSYGSLNAVMSSPSADQSQNKLSSPSLRRKTSNMDPSSSPQLDGKKKSSLARLRGLGG